MRDRAIRRLGPVNRQQYPYPRDRSRSGSCGASRRESGARGESAPVLGELVRRAIRVSFHVRAEQAGRLLPIHR
jgi:hypothetical protein